MRKSFGILSLAALFILPAFSSYGDDAVREKAREIYKNQADSVYWIRAVVNIEVSAGARSEPPREQSVESLGTVIDPSGLMVTSATVLDPSTGANGRTVNLNGEMVELQVRSDFKEVRVLMPDGAEVPAKVIMKDADLDLAFVMPDWDSDEAIDAEFEALSLASEKNPEILDQVIILSRLGQDLDRQPNIAIGEVTALIRKPRQFFRTTFGAAGAPTFAADGELLGINVRRLQNGRPVNLITLPSKDVKNIADQALAILENSEEEDSAEATEDAAEEVEDAFEEEGS